MSDASDSTATPRRRATDRAIETRAVAAMPGRMTSPDDEVIEAMPLRSARHDPSFLTHLIAIAERFPQTCVLRRASPDDAMAAYRAADSKRHTAQVGITTRQNA